MFQQPSYFLALVLLGVFLLVEAAPRDILERDLDDTDDMAIEERDADLACSSGWIRFGDHCYILTAKPGPKEEGKKQCKALGAGDQLASIETKEESDFISKTYTKTGKQGYDIYIGLTDLSGNIEDGPQAKRNFVWDDGNKATFRAWDEGEPNNHASSGNTPCTVIWFHTGTWNDKWCTANDAVALCKTAVAPTCGSGWQRHGNNCYRLTTTAGGKDIGKKECEALGGGSKIASIDNKQENDFILKAYTGSKGNDIYIGLTDLSGNIEDGPQAKRNFVWDDGNKATFRGWDEGEPNNHASSGNTPCTVIWRDSGKWNDKWCDHKEAVTLCKKVLA